MAMPNNLVLVRHGRSKGNEARAAERQGDESLFTPEFREQPGHRWDLTSEGEEQARCAGRFLLKQFGIDAFDRYIYSPYVRPRKTAGFVGQVAAPNAKWTHDRRLRERDWGDLDNMPYKEYVKGYPENAARKQTDPLYWAPVGGGESIAQVSNRFRDFLVTLHRECEAKNVLVSVHGEFMWVARLVLEYMSDETWLRLKRDASQNIPNGAVLHYTRINPETQEQARSMHWVSQTNTWTRNENGLIVPQEESGLWQYFEKPHYTNEQLLAMDD
jgi:broad specificity phosphatase PhoE